jgi:hypothetical protein
MMYDSLSSIGWMATFFGRKEKKKYRSKKKENDLIVGWAGSIQ